MTWLLNDDEFNAILALDSSKRAEHTVKRIADCGELWGLRRDGKWLIYGDATGREYMPIWPHRRYASACARGEWDHAVPASIAIDHWLGPWTSGLQADARFVAIFPTPLDNAPVVAPADFAQLVREELRKYDDR